MIAQQMRNVMTMKNTLSVMIAISACLWPVPVVTSVPQQSIAVSTPNAQRTIRRASLSPAKEPMSVIPSLAVVSSTPNAKIISV